MGAPWVAGAQARIVGEIHGQQTVNVMHFATNDQIQDQGTLDTILLNLAQAIRDCVQTVLLPAVSIDWRFIQADARRIYPTPSDPILATGAPGNVGELGPASHSFAATLCNIRTGTGGRRGRGRIFLPPPGEANVTASLVDDATLVLLAAFTACVGAKFIGAQKETPWTLGVLSKKDLAGVLGNFDNAFRIATSLNLKADCAIMGSRRRNRGS